MKRFRKILEALELEMHDELNDKIWDDEDHLNSIVKDHLLKIANIFIEFVDIPENSIEDIVFCGGNANYNYTKYSDMDIHIIVNDNAFKGCDKYAEDYFKAKKNLWSYEHDITIKGYPVELYIQPMSEKFTTNQGVYSLNADEWIQKPTKVKVDLEDTTLTAKIEDMESLIDSLVSNHSDDIEKIQTVKDKIVKMRRDAISSGGEFALGNLVFKSLRNSGYLDKLWKLEKQETDKELSLENKGEI